MAVMVGPNKQFDKNEVLEKAMLVFWEKGYEATSMQDLVISMGINRASMYQTYGNKYTLFLASIVLYQDNTLGFMKESLSQSGSPLGNLQQLFKIIIERSLESQQHGCLINSTAVELASHDDKIADTLGTFYVELDRIFEEQLRNAQQHNEIADDRDLKQLAFLLNTNLQGLLVQTKAKLAKQRLFDSVNHIFNYIHN